MNATDIIGWTYEGATYCTEHGPGTAVGDAPPNEWAPIFGSDYASFVDGGAECDTCHAIIVKNDTCPTCDRSLETEHDTYQYGPERSWTRTDPQCRPHRLATVLVRVRAANGAVAVYAQEVPYDEPAADDGMRSTEIDGAEALDALVAAFVGRVATFDLVSTEEVTA